MFFWFKKEKIVLDCFTSDALVFDRYKPEKATHCLPEWFKKLDGKHVQGNMKHCRGFRELFKRSISINMWTTFICNIDTQEKKWNWQSGTPLIVDEHPPEMYGSFLRPDEYDHIKLSSPWYLKTNKFINFVWMDALWNKDTHDYFSPNAIIDFFYQHGSNINIFFNIKRSSYTLTIEAGQPLVFIVPLTEKKIEIHTHLVTQQEMLRYTSVDVQGPRRYYIRKKHTDKILSQQKKCPLGFGK